MTTNRRESLERLREQLASIEHEIRVLVRTCPHDKGYHVGYWSWRIGSMDVMKICNECCSTVGSPSQDELKRFYKARRDETAKNLKDQGYGEEAISEVLRSML